MSDYETVIDAVRTTYNLSNTSMCVPNDQFVQFAQLVVFKTDAIKLGVVCFIIGMLFVFLMIELDKRWK